MLPRNLDADWHVHISSRWKQRYDKFLPILARHNDKDSGLIAT